MGWIFGAQIVCFVAIVYHMYKQSQENKYADKLLLLAGEYVNKYNVDDGRK